MRAIPGSGEHAGMRAIPGSGKHAGCVRSQGALPESSGKRRPQAVNSQFELESPPFSENSRTLEVSSNVLRFQGVLHFQGAIRIQLRGVN
jgi:hypothetical protein